MGCSRATPGSVGNFQGGDLGSPGPLGRLYLSLALVLAAATEGAVPVSPRARGTPVLSVQAAMGMVRCQG